VSNALPISLDQFRCSQCGAPFSEVTELPIPSSARIRPTRNAAWRRKTTSANIVEPPLLQCRACNLSFMSQHVLRSVLLLNRPSYWPPWKSPLTPDEITEQAIAEVGCRNGMNQAVNIVDERVKMQLSLSTASYLRNELGLSSSETKKWLDHANASQMEMCKYDDDPFKNEYLVRLIEMLPPSKSDNRMSSKHFDYMVSALVLLLNHHLWSHTSSCFKHSRATASAAACRYSFPRERVVSTSFTSSGIDLCREVAHEFINGYNYVLMATFKCNHDIQFLLGVNDATDRIHYCCKYVTKHQLRLDSSVAVALAAFKRRQEKENEEEMVSTSLQAQPQIAVARKRVASMAYAMRN
jgi:hypothetical protein